MHDHICFVSSHVCSTWDENVKIGRFSIKIYFLFDDNNDENNVKTHKCIMLRTLFESRKGKQICNVENKQFGLVYTKHTLI